MSVRSWFSVNGTQSFNHKKMQDISRQPSSMNAGWSNLWVSQFFTFLTKIKK